MHKASQEYGLSFTPGYIVTGSNSGYQAVNLAVQFGAKRILLLGFDMTIARGIHWHGPHGDGLKNPSDGTCLTWRTLFAAAVPDLKQAGVEVINVTPNSALTCFPMRALTDVL